MLFVAEAIKSGVEQSGPPFCASARNWCAPGVNSSVARHFRPCVSVIETGIGLPSTKTETLAIPLLVPHAGRWTVVLVSVLMRDKPSVVADHGAEPEAGPTLVITPGP